jgi:hypothetical protein
MTERAKIVDRWGVYDDERGTNGAQDDHRERFLTEGSGDLKQSVQVVMRYADGRRGQVVADAHVDDEIVKQIAKSKQQQARRGRKPKGEPS